MGAADVLVHTGSSLPSAVALLAPDSQLYFQSPPKERDGWDTYAVSAAVNVLGDGKLHAVQPFLSRVMKDREDLSEKPDANIRQVVRFLHAIYLRRFKELPLSLQEVEEDKSHGELGSGSQELEDLLGFKVGCRSPAWQYCQFFFAYNCEEGLLIT